MDAIQTQLLDHDRRIQRLEDTFGDMKDTTNQTQKQMRDVTSRIDQLYKAVLTVGVTIIVSLIGVIVTVAVH